MNKSDLVNNIAKKYDNLSVAEIKKTVNLVFEQLASSLISGDRIEIRGFGSFSVRERNMQKARNPKTNDIIAPINARVVYYRTSSELLKELNPDVEIKQEAD